MSAWDNVPDSCLPAAALDLNTYAPDARACVIGHPFRSEADCVLPEDWDRFLCRRCVEAVAHETWPESVHATSIQSELDRLEREDPAVQAAAAHDLEMWANPYDMDDDERRGF